MIIDPATEEFGGENPAPVQVFYGPSDMYVPVSYASYYEINRHYWKQQLYPSIGIIGENLARFFPFISIDGASRMSLRIGSQEAFLQSCEDLGRHTLEFYKSLKPADWIIPPEVLSSIQGTISEIKRDLLLGKDIRANTYSPISDASFLEFISNLEANLNPYYDGS